MRSGIGGPGRLFFIQLAICLGLFGLDIGSGPGIADGIGYSVVIVLCLRYPKRAYSLGWAVVCTSLVIAAAIIVPDRDFLHSATINRGLEICTVWAIWLLIITVIPTIEMTKHASATEEGPQARPSRIAKTARELSDS